MEKSQFLKENKLQANKAAPKISYTLLNDTQTLLLRTDNTLSITHSESYYRRPISYLMCVLLEHALNLKTQTSHMFVWF